MFAGTTIKLYDYRKPIKARHTGSTGPYQFTVGSLITGYRDARKGFSGYLNRTETELDEGSHVRLRVERADAHYSKAVDWYCDESQDQTMFGVVARLPHGRGFLAGWSMGAQMATVFETVIYDTIDTAARVADDNARYAAQKEFDYQAKERYAREAEQALTELRTGDV